MHSLLHFILLKAKTAFAKYAVNMVQLMSTVHFHEHPDRVLKNNKESRKQLKMLATRNKLKRICLKG